MSVTIDSYVFESLMKDLVGHDKQPSAFLLYLYLWHESFAKNRETVEISLRELAEFTGLSKSAVQAAVRVLKRRQLISIKMETPTSIPKYRVKRTWVRVSRPATVQSS